MHLILIASWNLIKKNTSTHDFVVVTYSFTWGGIYFLMVISLIITSVYSELASEGSPADGYFIKAFCGYLMGVWISRSWSFGTYPAAMYITKIWSLSKGGFKVFGSSHIQSCIIFVASNDIFPFYYLKFIYPWDSPTHCLCNIIVMLFRDFYPFNTYFWYTKYLWSRFHIS